MKKFTKTGLIAGGKPFPDISAAFLEVADGEVDQLGCGVLGGERAARPDRLAECGGLENSVGHFSRRMRFRLSIAFVV